MRSKDFAKASGLAVVFVLTAHLLSGEPSKCYY